MIALPDKACVLLDAAPIIYRFEDHPTLRKRFDPVFEAQAAGQITFALSTVTLAEVLVGPLRHGDEIMAQRYRTMLEGWNAVPLDAELAMEAARIRATLGLKLYDAALVATAFHIGADAIVTHDRDLSRVRGLNVITGE